MVVVMLRRGGLRLAEFNDDLASTGHHFAASHCFLDEILSDVESEEYLEMLEGRRLGRGWQSQ